MLSSSPPMAAPFRSHKKLKEVTPGQARRASLRALRSVKFPLPPSNVLEVMVSAFEIEKGCQAILGYPTPRTSSVVRPSIVYPLSWYTFVELRGMEGWTPWLETWAGCWMPAGWTMDGKPWASYFYAQVVYLQLYRWWDLSKGTFSGVPPAKFIIAFDHALEEDMYM